MGSLYSTPVPTPTQKPPSVMPLVGCGKYETGCADLMVHCHGGEGQKGMAEEPEELRSVFFRIFYPTQLKATLLTAETKYQASNTNEEENKENAEPTVPTTSYVPSRETPASPAHVEYPEWRPRREYVDGLAAYRNSNPFYIHLFLDWILGERRISAGWQQPLLKVDEQECAFPVVVFSHGISGHRTCYTTYCSSLASYGFVVAAVEHRDKSAAWSFYMQPSGSDSAEFEQLTECPVPITTFPEGEKEFEARNHQLHIRVRECVHALRVLEQLNEGTLGDKRDINTSSGTVTFGQEFNWKQFRGRLDLSKASIIGHSMGGASAIAVSALHENFKASVILDGWFYPIEKELYAKCNRRPTLLINASKWQWAENVRRMLKIPISSGSEKILLTMKDIVHQSFSDFSFLMPGYVGRKFCVQGELDPCHTGEAMLELTVAFLRKSLEGERAYETVIETVGRYSHFVIEGTDIDWEKHEKETHSAESIDDVVNINKDAESSGNEANM